MQPYPRWKKLPHPGPLPMGMGDDVFTCSFIHIENGIHRLLANTDCRLSNS